MKTITAKQIIQTTGVSNNLANKYLRGVTKPSYENIILLNKKLKVPFTAWEDIKSYLQENNTTNHHHKSNTQQLKQG